ncbi:helix-turn-helix transcriptional regulator [Thorsellia anophelis]|uniref:Putative transcriptional regulator n=1 Tax=Thorsellia anophelis DSM 18579 TaxID=1123402 RepID=A0A1I0D9M3_9GAMM|nr:helix-turn-helix transcriptional regulator [Thorsellia anophelis]SET28948.1 putative transcriptional regulator [Thorsellia anophelis DSM 18579]
MNNLKQIRKAIGLSQCALSKSIGVTQGAIGHYEAGRRSPDLQTCRAIVEELNSRGASCSLDDVFPPLSTQ